MKCEVPLTPEQCLFAAENHDLVYKFLYEKQLSINEFYDVVIFAYLQSVRRFLTEPKLKQYSFGTIAWSSMNRATYNYYRSQKALKHNADVISLYAKANEDSLPLEETIASPNPLLRQLEEQLLLHDLAKRISKQQMSIVRLKSYGYNDCDIARQQNITTKRVQKLLKEVRRVFLQICYG